MLRAAAICSGVIAAACSAGNPASNPAIALRTPSSGGSAYIEVTGLAPQQLRAVRAAALTDAKWSEVLRVSVDDKSPGMLGTYSVTGSALRFTPQFALDPGRPYVVRFDPAHLPGTGTGTATAFPSVLVATVKVPATQTAASTTVARVYPSGNAVPENLLRIYVEFSGPMGRPSGIPHMKLLGTGGHEIEGAFLPLDYEFWDKAHTRFTAFLDPGRVKSGILPNKQMGRALDAGREITLVISREWRDQYGLPLKDEYRHVFKVAAPVKTALDPATWRIEPPVSNSREPLTVTFPRPLDHGLLMRALGVTREDASIPGDVVIQDGETRWVFTPREPWRTGRYHLLALDTLEDVSGNQIGRAFEVDNFETVDKSPNPQRILIPFSTLN